MTDSHLLLPLPFASTSSQRITRDISHTLLQFLNNLIYNSTTPLSFETYPEDIYTTPLIREHHDSYLYYIATHSLLPNSDEPPFSIPFTSPTTHCDTFQKNIHPNNIQIPIAHVFTTFLNNLQEKITFYLNMFLTLPPFKNFFKRNLFLTFLILNNFALLKIILTIGLPQIYFKFITFNINFSKILPSIKIPKNKFKYTPFFFANFSDIITN